MSRAAVLLLLAACGAGALLRGAEPAPAVDPADAHDVLIRVGDGPAFRLRLRVEQGGKPLARLDAEVRKRREALRGGPADKVLTRLLPEGSLLRVETMPAASPHSARLTRALFAALDRNHDGKVTKGELADAPRLLATLDIDGDECLTPLELVPDLLNAPAPGTSPTGAAVEVVPASGRADREVTIRLGPTRRDRWLGRHGELAIDLSSAVVPPLPSKLPTSLAGEGKEAERALYETAVGGIVTLVVEPGPRNWFDILDANHDGRLGLRELRGAAQALAADLEARGGMLTLPEKAPPAVTLTLVPGICRGLATPLARMPEPARGPAWFRAMDRNGDGDVSRAEFLGTDAQFKAIDTDGDGLISPEEAEAFDVRRKRDKP
jgi:Ca2+-binding EF-hand superfamily protein